LDEFSDHYRDVHVETTSTSNNSQVKAQRNSILQVILFVFYPAVPNLFIDRANIGGKNYLLASFGLVNKMLGIMVVINSSTWEFCSDLVQANLP
jgi:glutaredoxin